MGSHLTVLEEAELPFLPVVTEVTKPWEEQIGGHQNTDVHVQG